MTCALALAGIAFGLLLGTTLAWVVVEVSHR